MLSGITFPNPNALFLSLPHTLHWELLSFLPSDGATVSGGDQGKRHPIRFQWSGGGGGELTSHLVTLLHLSGVWGWGRMESGRRGPEMCSSKR